MAKTLQPNNRILFYTLITLIIITVYMTVNSYYTQLHIFQEKELFKLDCVASALTFNIDGDEHERLFNEYPGPELRESAAMDSFYMALSQRMGMAKSMNEITTDIYTLVYDSLEMDFIFGISSSSSPLWMQRWDSYPPEIRENYYKGGLVSEPYKDEHGTWLSAFSPITNSKGEVKAILQVDEKFDNFIMRARSQIYMNIGISLVFICILGILMYFSVRSILKHQERIKNEKLEVEIMRKDLIANISHDLRTPLSSIYGYLETIQMKKASLSPDKIDRYLNVSLKNTEKLKKLVDELFELSNLESKDIKINLEETNINDLILDVVNDFKLSAEKKKINITTQLSDEGSQVFADIQLIERVFQNLLGNSIKFCRPEDEIKITSQFQTNTFQINITDTGVGIEAEELENIFNRYSMGKGDEAGTGLGLAIVKNILDLHQSEYDIQSTIGSGTTFSFTLKVASK